MRLERETLRIRSSADVLQIMRQLRRLAGGLLLPFQIRPTPALPHDLLHSDPRPGEGGQKELRMLR